MPNLNINSFSLKIFLSFFILALFLLTILFFQIIPDMKIKEQEHRKNHIENIIYVTTHQIKLAEKALKNNGQRRRDELKYIMQREANRISKNITNTKSFNKLETKDYEFRSKKIACNTSVLDKNKNLIIQNINENFEGIKEKLNINNFLRYDENTISTCTKGLRRLFYTKKLKESSNYLVVSCNINKFKSLGKSLEKNIKTDVQASFSLLNKFHKDKTYLMWLNTKNTSNNQALIQKNDNPEKSNKYCVSRLSNLRIPITGLLSADEIRKAINSEPIQHFLSSKEEPDLYVNKALTWVRLISENEKEKFLYLTTIYEKDYKKDIDSPLFKILPSAFISLGLVILLGFLLFRRLFKTINILTNTATQVIKGNLNKRNYIEGSDDIAILAKAFDKMLDFLEKNIENLDRKVENKTKELSSSLNEKEILLKEIHHRVKNNLAITINLIKLEKSKISNEDTKNSLRNIEERVFVMELLHRKLYESKDLSTISLNKYIKELCGDLNTSYSKSKDIKIITNIKDIDITIDYALPLGLIITELVTNSFKYAFKDKGLIEVSFTKENENYSLVVQDNGIGLDNSIDINNTSSLGLQIVSNIIKGQLFGDFTYSYEKGSKFEIKFEIKDT